MLRMKKTVLFAILGNVVFGFSLLASRITLQTVDPVLLLAIYFIVTFVVLNVLLLLGAFKVRLKGENLGVLIPISVCQPVIYFLCKDYGLQYVTSSFFGPMIVMIPAMTFLLTTVILGGPFRMNKFAWALRLVARVCVISITGGGDGGASVKEALFLIGAVAPGSLYTVLSKKCSGTLTMVERTYATFAAGCVSLLTTASTREGGSLVPACVQACKTPKFASAMLYLTVISPAVVLFSMNCAAAYLPATQTSSLVNLATLVSIMVDVVFLGKTSGTKEVARAVLILCGVFMPNRADNKTTVT